MFPDKELHRTRPLAIIDIKNETHSFFGRVQCCFLLGYPVLQIQKTHSQLLRLRRTELFVNPTKSIYEREDLTAT